MRLLRDKIDTYPQIHVRKFNMLKNRVNRDHPEIASCASKKEIPLIKWNNWTKFVIFLVNELKINTVDLK